MQVAIAALIGGFFALRELLDPSLLMSLLNGVFAGAVVTLVAAYYRLIVAAIRGNGEQGRVQQMALGLFVLWMSMVVNVGVSIYARSTEFDPTTYTGAAAARYLAIIAAVLQMRSLDYAYALFHGRDRTMIAASLFLGVAVAIAVVALQQW
jgi:hypothetical protein